MHVIQEKLLKLIGTQEVSNLTLRNIAQLIGESGSPQKIKHHLDQLAKKGLIKIDKKNGKIVKEISGLSEKGNLVSLPIMGSTNCGEALFFADNHIEGYLKITKTVLGEWVNRIKDLFVLRVVGSSMNRANVYNNTIEDGDYVIVNKKYKAVRDGEYVVSIIDGVANIKKIFVDSKNQQIILISESNQDLPPIYIHRNDLGGYLIAGKVVKVMKKPDELVAFRDVGGRDVTKDLGKISKDEYDYYENLCSKKVK